MKPNIKVRPKERAVKYRKSFITDFSMEDGTFGKNASWYACSRAETHRLHLFRFFFEILKNFELFRSYIEVS